jgi:hypothetical protein
MKVSDEVLFVGDYLVETPLQQFRVMLTERIGDEHYAYQLVAYLL